MKEKRDDGKKKILLLINRFLFLIIVANHLELKSLLEQEGIDLPVFIDTKDEFLLSGKIADEKENPIIINEDDLRRT